MKYVLIIVTLLVAFVTFALSNGYRMKEISAVDLPGFTTGQLYIVQGVSDPKYGFKFKVTNDEGESKLLSPWHFGYNYQ